MIKVLIADDHAIVREGLKQILADTSDIVVGGEAVNATQTLERVVKEEWGVVVLDITMPGRSGFDILKDLKAARPGLHVLVQSMHSEDQFALRALKAGAAGYINKESAPDELVKAIRKVNAGGRYVSPALAEKMALRQVNEETRPPHELLSHREYQVLLLIASGKTATQIAAQLSLSVKTVSTYRTRILEKMRLETNAELTHYAIQRRLVQ
jgi:DNA-binding NarL/FixJ family response regulator